MGVRVSRRVLLLALLAALHPASVPAQEAGETVVKRGVIADDLYLAGGDVDVLGEVSGDVVAAGGRVVVGRLVRGDVIVLGGSVDVTGRVLDDVRAAGGAVTIDGEVAGDAIAAGARVRLTPETKVRGRAWLAGGEVDVSGSVGRWLKAAAGRVRISGEVRGDVELAAREIEILPSARIEGDLTYYSPQPARIDPAARIAGTITHRRSALADEAAGAARTALRLSLIASLVGLMLAGTVLFLLLPGFTISAARTAVVEPWKSLGLGFALFVAVPAAAGLLMATIVGVPLGLTVMALYVVSLLLGILTAAFSLGDLGVRLLARGREVSKGVRVLSLVGALLVLYVLRMIPVVGWVILPVALLFGLGASIIATYRVYAAAGLRAPLA